VLHRISFPYCRGDQLVLRHYLLPVLQNPVIIAIAFTDGSGTESLKADSGMLCSGLVRFVNGIGASKNLSFYEDERNGPFCASAKG
jgi:hypothetical protein